MPCTLDNVGTILCYQTLSMILINALDCTSTFLLCLNFINLFYVYVYILYELFFSWVILCACFLV